MGERPASERATARGRTVTKPRRHKSSDGLDLRASTGRGGKKPEEKSKRSRSTNSTKRDRGKEDKNTSSHSRGKASKDQDKKDKDRKEDKGKKEKDKGKSKEKTSSSKSGEKSKPEASDNKSSSGRDLSPLRNLIEGTVKEIKDLGDTDMKSIGDVVQLSWIKPTASAGSLEKCQTGAAKTQQESQANTDTTKTQVNKNSKKEKTKKEKDKKSKDKGNDKEKAKDKGTKDKKSKKKDKETNDSSPKKQYTGLDDKIKRSASNNSVDDETSVASSVLNPEKTKISVSKWDSMHTSPKRNNKKNEKKNDKTKKFQAQQKQLDDKKIVELSWFGFAKDDSNKDNDDDDDDDSTDSSRSLDDGSFCSIQRDNKGEEDSDDGSIGVDDLLQSMNECSKYSNNIDESDNNSNTSESSSEASDIDSGSDESAQRRAAKKKDARAAKKREAKLREVKRQKWLQEKATKKKQTPVERTDSGGNQSQRTRTQHMSLRDADMNSSYCSTHSNRSSHRRRSRGKPKLQAGDPGMHRSLSTGMSMARYQRQQDSFEELSQSMADLDPFGFIVHDDVDSFQNSFSETTPRSKRATPLRRSVSVDESTSRFRSNDDDSRRGGRRIPRNASFDDNPHSRVTRSGRRRGDGDSSNDFHNSMSSFRGERNRQTFEDLNSSKHSLRGGSRHGRNVSTDGPFNDLHSSKRGGSRHGRSIDPFADLNSSKQSLRGGRSVPTDDPFNDLNRSKNDLNRSKNDFNSSVRSVGRRGMGRQAHQLQSKTLKSSLDQSQDHLALVENGKWMAEREEAKKRQINSRFQSNGGRLL